MTIATLKERFAGEKRVAMVPAALAPLLKAGHVPWVVHQAGNAAGFTDIAYEQAGAILQTEEDASTADILLLVRAFGADPDNAADLIGRLNPGQVVIASADPLSDPELWRSVAASGATVFALELLPRTTRAQSMDILSSQANLAGYKAVLLGAEALNKILPMMTTAAGTIPPSKVLVLGAGVAGLQAIATARRLGAVVTGYDIRPETKTQIESLGARALDLGIDAKQGEGGYAAQQDADFYAKQQAPMEDAVGEFDLVVTTAAVPGRKAPILLTQRMVERMKPGSVVVDMAAEKGGNCELTQPGQTVKHNGVRILGPLNLPSTLAHHASALYAKNVANFVLHIAPKGELVLDLEDPIISDTLVTHQGEIVNSRIKEAIGG